MKLQYIHKKAQPERWLQRYVLVCRALHGACGNRQLAAFALHVPTRTLHYWVSQYRQAGMEIPVYKRRHARNVVLQPGLATLTLDMSTADAVGQYCAGSFLTETQTNETRVSD
jgi:hypothetical protein